MSKQMLSSSVQLTNWGYALAQLVLQMPILQAHKGTNGEDRTLSPRAGRTRTGGEVTGW